MSMETRAQPANTFRGPRSCDGQRCRRSLSAQSSLARLAGHESRRPGDRAPSGSVGQSSERIFRSSGNDAGHRWGVERPVLGKVSTAGPTNAAGAKVFRVIGDHGLETTFNDRLLPPPAFREEGSEAYDIGLGRGGATETSALEVRNCRCRKRGIGSGRVSGAVLALNILS